MVLVYLIPRERFGWRESQREETRISIFETHRFYGFEYTSPYLKQRLPLWQFSQPFISATSLFMFEEKITPLDNDAKACILRYQACRIHSTSHPSPVGLLYNHKKWLLYIHRARRWKGLLPDIGPTEGVKHF